jgi:hypothetical protein
MKLPAAIAQEHYFYDNSEASRIFMSNDPMWKKPIEGIENATEAGTRSRKEES